MHVSHANYAIEHLGGETCRIVLSPLIDLDAEYHIEIGASFKDLLIRLDNNEESFNA